MVVLEPGEGRQQPANVGINADPLSAYRTPEFESANWRRGSLPLVYLLLNKDDSRCELFHINESDVNARTVLTTKPALHFSTDCLLPLIGRATTSLFENAHRPLIVVAEVGYNSTLSNCSASG